MGCDCINSFSFYLFSMSRPFFRLGDLSAKSFNRPKGLLKRCFYLYKAELEP